MIKSALNPVLHLTAVLVALVNTNAALALYAAIPVLFFLPSRLEHFTAAKPIEEASLE
jgi:hypothetical protein